jgi:glucokinase
LASRDGLCITSLPNRLPGLENLNWQHWLELPAPIPVFNDAQAALLAEVWRGAAKGVSNVILITLGTGVGGAAMVDGLVLRGHTGRAGHLGHVSLDPEGTPDIVNTPGSLEDAIGEHNLGARTNGQFKSTRELVEAFRQGSAGAAKIWLRSVRALAAAIAGFINVLDPEVIVIGGGIADADDALFGPLQTALERFEWRPGGARARVVKAILGRKAGAIGAAYGALLASTNATLVPRAPAPSPS